MREHQTNRLEFNLTRENAGQYTCTAWNSNGRDERSIRVDYYGEYSGESEQVKCDAFAQKILLSKCQPSLFEIKLNFRKILDDVVH